jgi:hypothetical protein
MMGRVEGKHFELKALTHKQLAQMYGVSWSTFRNWMKKVEGEVGRKTGHFYHVHQVKKIFEIFGVPDQAILVSNDLDELIKNER